MNSKKLIGDSVLLTVVKVVTMILGMVQTMILAHSLSTGNFALYSQSTTCVTLTASLSLLGLADSVTFYYNRNTDENRRIVYLNTIFFIQILTGIAAALLLFFARVFIADWMQNPDLQYIIPIILIEPLFSNLINSCQMLFFSASLAREIAIRNLLFSGLKLLVTIIAVFCGTQQVMLYWIFMIALDLLQILYFLVYYNRRTEHKIRILKYDAKLFGTILKYSIPLGIAIVVNSIMRECDKLMISNQCPTADYATYAAVSRQLPVALFAASISSLIIPHLTKSIHEKKQAEIYQYMNIYYFSGALTTVLIGMAVLAVSRDAVVFLYSEKYVGGLAIFIVYLFVDIIGYAYPGLLLTVTGNSRLLLIFNCAALGANIVLNAILLHFLGIIGPAVATLLISVVNFIFQSSVGCRKAGIRFGDAFPYRKILMVMLRCAAASGIVILIHHFVSFGTILNLVIFGSAALVLCCLVSVPYIKDMRAELHNTGDAAAEKDQS